MIETATEYLGKECFSAKYLIWKKLYVEGTESKKSSVVGVG